MKNTLVKTKQEACGWSKDCCTTEEKNKYKSEFLERGCDNPCLLSFAKLMLNPFWGKFGQRENQPKTKIIN